MYDVVIIGAGPAGATLARLIGHGHRVLLVDRRSLANRHENASADKLCGGLIAPAAQKELARQGLGIPGDVVVGPQLFAVRTVDRDAALERLYQRNYLNIDRGLFDRWLVSLVPDRVERAFGWMATAIEPDKDGVTVRFSTPGGGKASVRSRIVVGADGSASITRRLGVSSAASMTRYAAVQAVYEAPRCDPYYGAFFDSSVTDYYAWMIPKGESMVVGAAFASGTDAVARFETLVSNLRADGLRIGQEWSRAGAGVARPERLSDLCLGSGRVALVGEAAGLISPSSAEGISYALRSAAALAETLEPGIEDALLRYRDAVWPVKLEVIAKMVKSRAIYGPTLRRAIMRSGVGSIPSQGLGGFGSLASELLTP